MSEGTTTERNAQSSSGYGRWNRTWGAAPQPGVVPPEGGVLRSGVTLRQVVRVSGGGTLIRARFSNEFGVKALSIGAASIGLAGPDGTTLTGSAQRLTFGGAGGAIAPAGAAVLSDETPFALEPLTEVVVSVFLPEGTESPTSHNIPTSIGWAVPGDAVHVTAVPAVAMPLPDLTTLSALEVFTNAPSVGIVTIGDSITDGAGATPGAHHTWPELLAARLHQEGVPAFVSNQGISGNRLLHPGYGEAALVRFDRDVLATPGMNVVIVFQGINDIGFQYGDATPDDAPGEFMGVPRGSISGASAIIDGYRQLITRTRMHGARVYGATLTPYAGAEFHTPAGEQVRRQVNDWIRTSGAFDAVLDFEAAWLDHTTGGITDGYHWGDHLHGSDAGYQALADCIDLRLFA